MENALTSLAFLDAKHDFGDYAYMFGDVLRASLPGTALEIGNEEAAINAAAEYAESLENINGYTPNTLFTSLGGSETRPIAIVCDAAFCSDIIDMLAMNTIGKVYFVINREVMNDPGNNGTPKETHALTIARDKSPDPITYTSYVSDNIIDYQNIHSKLSIKLTTDAKCTTYSNNEKVEQTESSKHNEIGRVLNTIMFAKSALEIQSAFLRKRAGDWLQVLSCRDKDRLYEIKGELKNLSDCNVYFCSSDRIAIAFALYNDINCIFKRDMSYLMYKSRNPSPYLSGLPLFLHHRSNAIHHIPMLKTGVELYRKLKTEWGKQLMEIEHATTLDELKQLLLLSIHYSTLQDEYATWRQIGLIEKFIENHMDPMFEELNNYMPINRAISGFDYQIRRYTYLNAFETSSLEAYYHIFSPGNTSIDSYDMLYNCTILGSLVFSNDDPLLEDFVIKYMKKNLELTGHNIQLQTLYNLFTESHAEYFRFTNKRDETRIHHVGGFGGDTKYALKVIGDYLTKYILIPYLEHSLCISDDYNFTLNYDSRIERIVEYLIYKKHIIPKDYIIYVNSVNSEYEKGRGRLEELAAFLKMRNKKRKTVSRMRKRKMMTRRRRKHF